MPDGDARPMPHGPEHEQLGPRDLDADRIEVPNRAHEAAKHHHARRPRRLGLFGVIVLIAAIAAAAYGIFSRGHHDKELAQWTDAQAVPTVAVMSPRQGSATRSLVLPGDVQAWYEASIYARVPGYLQSWSTDIGARVKAGQLLGMIDTPDLDQQVAQAKADLATADARAALADLTASRWNALRGTNSISVQSADEKAGEAKAARAEENAKKAAVQRLQTLEVFKRLVAPFDGVVTARNTDIGALINVGSSAGLPLFKVADMHEMRVYVRVPQSYAAQITVGMPATLTLPQYPGETFPAVVSTTANAIALDSRTVLVELLAKNPDGKLWAGTYAQVDFKLPANAAVLRVPTSAIIFRDGAQLAVVGPDNKATLKDVTIGRNLGQEVEIESGLAATDHVVVTPPDTLNDGDTVRVQDDATTTAAE